ncbi:legume-like lectin, partial [Linderina pennispora]
LRSFTLEAPYIDEGFQIRNYDFGGDAIVNSMGNIRLTPDLSSRQGWLWSTTTLPNDYWKVEFDFKIGGKGGYLYGDGMGFFVTKDRATAGPVFGNKDYFNGLGVFFDTYPNGKHDFSVPFIMGMIGDGKTAYDNAHDGDANRKGMCEAYFRNLKDSSKAQVTYLKGQFLNVQIQLQPHDKWINCFTISGVTLPEDSYLGFSALTGDISDNHDLISVRAETLR